MRTLICRFAVVFVLCMVGISTAHAQLPDCETLAAAQLRGRSDTTAVVIARTLYDCASTLREQGNTSAAISLLTTANGLDHSLETHRLKIDILRLLHSCYTDEGRYRHADAISQSMADLHAQFAALQSRDAGLLASALKEQREETRKAQEKTHEQLLQLQLLKSEIERTQHRLDVADGWMERDRINLMQEKQKWQLLEKDRQIQAGRIERDVLIRNVLFASAAIALVMAFLVYRRLKDRRRASELKAEIAEARASAMEADRRQHEFESRKRFTRQLIDNQEQERKRIAADLHDGLGQDLLVIKNRLTLARREHEKGADPTGELEEILLAVTSSLQNIRSISRNLRPSQLDRIGLTSSVESMLNTLQDSCTFDLRYSLDDIDGLFSKEREIDVYRIVQEAMNNIIKHAQANTVTVEVALLESEVKITVNDNGRGFSSRISAHDDRQQAVGFGLQGMNERVQILGGILTIDSVPGEGTKITALLPVKQLSESMVHQQQEL